MDRKWKIISLGSQGLNRIYDPDGKDVTGFIKKTVCIFEGQETPRVYLEVLGEIDLQIDPTVEDGGKAINIMTSVESVLKMS